MARGLKSTFRALRRRLRDPGAIEPKPITPRDTQKPSLANLPPEILDLIIEHVHDTDPESLNALALVCSALHTLARYSQFQKVSLDFVRREELASQRVGFLAQKANAPLHAIRRLHVQSFQRLEFYFGLLNDKSRSKHTRLKAKDIKARLTPWKQLGDLVPLMPRLQDLYWSDAAIPDCVIEVLSKNPQVCLRLSLDLRLWSSLADGTVDVLKALPARLASTQGLSSLRIRIIYGFNALAVRAALQDSLKPLIVLSRSRLRALGLDIGFQTWGCVWFSPKSDYCGFGFTADEAFPALEELDILDYPWGRPWWLHPVMNFWADGYPHTLGGGTEMEHWAALRDWSKLRRLRLVGHSILLVEPLAPQLTSLEHLELISLNPHVNRRIAPFFATFPRALTSLTMAGLPPDLLPFITTTHAASLRALSIFAAATPPADLALLRDHLPNLNTLTLYCDPEPDRDDNPESENNTKTGPCPPDTTLTTLAGFPSLRDLTLRYHPNHPIPPITITTPGRVFTALRARGAVRLRTLRLQPGVLGDLERLGFRTAPLPADGPWEGEDRESQFGFECVWPGGGGGGAAVEGGVREGGGEVGPDADAFPLLDSSRCVVLDWEQNARLRRVVRGEGVMTEQEAGTGAFAVALRGPKAAPPAAVPLGP